MALVRTPIVPSALFVGTKHPGCTPRAPRRARLCVRSAGNIKTNNIKVVVNGAGRELGRAAIAAIHKARGMEVAGAVDVQFVGRDAGEIAGLDEALELPIVNDLVMVLGSLSQNTTSGVMVDFNTESKVVYDNVRQATAFGLKSVVCGAALEPEDLDALSTFCEKSSMGCIVAPTLSIGRILLQQAAVAAAFNYGYAEIIESQPGSKVYPSSEAQELALNLSGLGRIYNDGDLSQQHVARGAVVGDGVRVHSLSTPSGTSSLEIRLSSPWEVLSYKHDISDVRALMPGLLLAIRRVVRLKNLVYGLEKIL
ncbi:chloroplast NAD(P)H dehydrogenase [Marchantia polymorpha subsp. ruderalis]